MPLLQIDFGNGNIVRRTLKGNVATYICLTDGSVVDILPNLYEPVTYQRELGKLASLAHAVGQLDNNKRPGVLQKYHHGQEFAIAGKFMLVPAQAIGDWITHWQGREADPKQPEREIAQWRELYHDTAVNETVGRSEIHQLLAAFKTGVHPREITQTIYKEVLHTDIDDPYLGLGQALFGNSN